MRFFVFFVLGVGLVLRAPAASPLEEMKSLSQFENIDLAKLADGEILMDQMKIENLNRGIAAQACYIIKQPASQVSKRLEKWETCHSQPSAPYFHKDIHPPAKEETFSDLQLSSSDDGIKWLLEQTKETRADESELNFSRGEAEIVFQTMKTGKDPKLAEKVWKTVLLERAKGFFGKGLEGLGPLEMDEEVVHPSEELNEILGGLPKVKEHFGALFHSALLTQPSNQGGQSFYWELINENQHATFNLGTLYYQYEGDKFKALNFDYYISSETYISGTVYQIWPIDLSGKPAALIWRGEIASSPRLAQAKGVERMAAKQIILKDLRREIESFRKDTPH
jgi:hypothetical protein